MLRPYISRFEITAGRYDGGVTLHSREAPFVLGTLIYGLPHNFTLYGGTLVADDYLSAAGGIGLSMGSLGALSADEGLVGPAASAWGAEVELLRGSAPGPRLVRALLRLADGPDEVHNRTIARLEYARHGGLRR